MNICAITDATNAIIIIGFMLLKYVFIGILESLIKNKTKKIIIKKQNHFFTKNTVKKIKNETINFILGSRLCTKESPGKNLPNDIFFFIKFIYLYNLKNS